MTKVNSTLLCALLILGSVAPTRAEDAFKFFEEEAKVVTASRREQTVSELPVAVDVVTAKEIKASGAVNLWDLLRFRAGMDVLDARTADGNRAAVSVRGFPQEFAANVLVLVDGRSVYEPTLNGVHWEALPVSVQDIARIEIIRGPNAALYGSGAGLGVINIITKAPQGRTAFELDNRGGNRGMVHSFQSAESAAGKASYRISHAFHQQDGHPTASGAATGSDFLRKNVLNLRGSVRLSESSELEAFAGGSWSAMGQAALGNPRMNYNQDFQRLKYTQRFTPDSVLEVSGARNEAAYNPNYNGTLIPIRTTQHNGEFFHRLTWGDERMNTAYGATYRKVVSRSPALFGAYTSALQELFQGSFQQSATATEHLSFQGAIALESATGQGLKPSYQVSAVLAPTDRHAFRTSYSVAHTFQEIFNLVVDLSAPPFRFQGNPDLQPYKITSFETGYLGNLLDKRLTAGISAFYTTIENFHILAPSAADPNLLLLTTNDATISRGTEVQLKYRFTSSRSVYANYTYERITDQVGGIGTLNSGLRTQNTPAHKLNLGGMADLGRGFSAGVNAGYKDGYFIASETRFASVSVPAYWRLDARLAYVLPWHKDAECYVAGQNLLRPTHVEFADGLSVPRTFAGGVTVKF